MFNHWALLDGIWPWMWRITWQASVLVILVLVCQWLFRRQLTARWHDLLWLIVLVRLLMPAAPESALSVFNLAEPASVALGTMSSAVTQPPSKTNLLGKASANRPPPAEVEFEPAQEFLIDTEHGPVLVFPQPLNASTAGGSMGSQPDPSATTLRTLRLPQLAAANRTDSSAAGEPTDDSASHLVRYLLLLWMFGVMVCVLRVMLAHMGLRRQMLSKVTTTVVRSVRSTL